MALIDKYTFNEKIKPSYVRSIRKDGNVFKLINAYPSTIALDFDKCSMIVEFSPSDARPYLKYELSGGHLLFKTTDGQLDGAQMQVLTQKFTNGSELSLHSQTHYFHVEDINSDGYFYSSLRDLSPNEIRDAFEYGIYVWGYRTTIVADGANEPILDFYYSSPFYVYRESPSHNAEADKRTDITFSWELKTPTGSNPPSKLVAKNVKYFTFNWKVAGTDNLNTIDCGSTPSVTIPRNTFTGDAIEWNVTGFMEDMTFIKPASNLALMGVVEYLILNVNAKEAPSTATIIQPKDTIIDSQADVLLEWSHFTPTGSPATKSEVEISTDGVVFTPIATVLGPETKHLMERGSCNAGDLYWRVRTYNSEGLVGSWSEIAHVIVIGAPPAPQIALQSIAPRSVIKWQSSAQEAYQIEIRNAKGDICEQYSRFGQEKTLLTQLLENGVYAVQVRVQNKFGLWSSWAVASFSVKNVPGPIIHLTASVSHESFVQLIWDVPGGKYTVFRNGKAIARTQEMEWLDCFASGPSSYQILMEVDENGNYSMSEQKLIDIPITEMQIVSVKDRTWLSLGKSTTVLRSLKTTTNKQVGYYHLTDQDLPTAEIGKAVDCAFSFEVAWNTKDQTDITAFESMIGTLCCVKLPNDRRVVGILNDVAKTENILTTSFSATLTCVEWQEG